MVLISLVFTFLLLLVVLDGNFVFKVVVADVLGLTGFWLTVLPDSAVALVDLVIVDSVIFLDSGIVRAVNGVTVMV